ncbi:MAG: UDP-N-acetyl glucosamine 2-epimerase, partial [Planctomycetota bacterium]
EEVNRLLTDAISDLLFVTERSGLVNLANEGIAGAKVHFVGNVMIDSLLAHRAKADESRILSDLGLIPKRFVVVTLHRPSNVDDPDMLGVILDAFEQIGRDMPVVFPMHPRTRSSLASMGLQERAEAIPGLRITEPLGYLDFLKLMSESAVTMTDSGGIQEETTILGVPCLTLRENTERPVTVECGTNRLTRPGKDDIPAACRAAIAERSSQARVPELWDGLAAQRIADCLLRAG